MTLSCVFVPRSLSSSKPRAQEPGLQHSAPERVEWALKPHQNHSRVAQIVRRISRGDPSDDTERHRTTRVKS